MATRADRATEAAMLLWENWCASTRIDQLPVHCRPRTRLEGYAIQADVARIVELLEEQDKSELQLTDEQAAEVRRRLANPSPKRIPAEEVFRRFRSHGA